MGSLTGVLLGLLLASFWAIHMFCGLVVDTPPCGTFSCVGDFARAVVASLRRDFQMTMLLAVVGLAEPLWW